MAGVSVGKRIKISKIQQHMMLAILVASLVFGVSLVLSIYFVKYIMFNTKVIDEKDAAITTYYEAISNVGICTDSNKDNKYSEKELKECNPKEIKAEDVPGTLRNNVLVKMQENEDLESVARTDPTDEVSCYENGKKRDYVELYQNAEYDEQREEYFSKMKLCSSLRVVPDALPSVQNQEALLSSMNQIFLLSGIEPESLSPSNSVSTSPITGLEVIPINVSVKKDIGTTTRVLENLEKSIRSFYFTNAMISWKSGMGEDIELELSAQALAFYTNKVQAATTEKTIYASPEAKKASK